jgi:hypothetical protein
MPPNFTGMEDILTSNVFSFFKYVDRKVFLKSLLRKIDIKVSSNDLLNTDFIF